MIEIGPVDIATEVSMLSSHLAMPYKGHFYVALHIMAYLRQHPDIDECEWTKFYGNIREVIPSNALEPRGHPVQLRMYIDSDHAGGKQMRQSLTGMMIFCNTAMIEWTSKKQATIKSSDFGAKIVAVKFGIKKLRGLWYKLQMMGVPIDGPSLIYGNNLSVIKNSQTPESQLKKKKNAICYHAMCESVVMGESLCTHLHSEDNYADLITKVLTGQRRRDLVRPILYNIHNDHSIKTN